MPHMIKPKNLHQSRIFQSHIFTRLKSAILALCLSLFSLALWTPLAAAQSASHDLAGSDVYGLWLTQSKTVHVEIDDCGDTTLCGAVSYTHLTLPTIYSV